MIGQGGHGRAGPRRAHHRQPGSWCPLCRSTAGTWCRSSRATARNGRGGARPQLRTMRRRADRRPCRGGARRAAVPIDGGKLVPIIQGHGLASWCRSTPAGVREGRADRRREGGAHHAAPPCRSTAGKVVPIIQGHGSQRPRWCPWFPSCRSSTAGKVVPRRSPVVPCRGVDRRREGRAHHPGPRPGNGRGGARGFRYAHHRRWEGRADVPTAGSWCRSSRATARNGRGGARGFRCADHRQPGRSCRAGPPSCRAAVPPCRSTAGRSCPSCRRADHRPCRGGARRADRQPGRSCPSFRATARNGRGGARGFRRVDHRQPGRSCRAGPPSCRAAVSIDGGKVVPIIQGHGLATAAVVPVVSVMPIIDGGKVVPTCRRREAGADHPGPRLATAAVVPVVSVVPIIDSREGRAAPVPRRAVPPCRRADRRREGRARRAVVPIIDLAAVVPVVPIDSREGRAHHSGPRLATAAVVPVVSVVSIIDSREGRAAPVPRRAVPRCRSTAGRSCPSSRATAWQRPRWCPWFPSCPSSTVGRSCRRADGGNVVPIIQGHGSQRPRWCPSCRAAVPIIDSREGRAHHPGPRPGKLVPPVSRRAVPPCGSSTAGKVVPIIQGHGSQRPRWCPWFPSCPSSTVGRSCRRADGGKLVPIIQGHGSQRPRWCPSCRSSTAGNVVPPCRSTPARWCRSTAGTWCRSSRATAWQRPRWCPSCRAAVPIIDSREGRAHHPGPRPGKLVPRRSPSCRRVNRRRQGGADRLREGNAHHPGPRLATAAVVPVVPIDSREGRARRAAVPIDGGKVVPIIQGHGLASWCRAGPPSCRRADRRRPVSGKVVPIIRGHGLASWCRAGPPSCRRADRRREGRAHHRRRERGAVPSCRSTPASWCRSSTLPRWCPSCRSTAGKLVPIIQGHGLATAAVVPVRNCGQCAAVPIDGGKLVPIIDAGRCPGSWCRAGPPSCRRVDRRREGRAHHRRREGRADVPTAGKVVPITQGHGLASWCRAGPPVVPRRRANRRRPVSGKLVPRRFPVMPSCRSTAGRSCPSSRATAWQRPRWCPWFPSCPSSTVGRSCRRADGGKLVPIIQGHNLASWCRAGPPSCRRVDRRRQGGADRRRGGRAHHPGPRPGNGRGGARGFRHADHRQPGRWCPSCRAAVPIIDSREGRADHPGPRPGKLVPRRSPVMPSCRAAGRCPGRSCRSTAGRWCRSSRATARNGRGGARRADHRQPGSWCPSCRAVVPIDAGLCPGRSCRAGPPSCRAAVPIDGGKVVPIIQGHGSQRPRWCPSCRSSTAGKLVPIVPRRRADRRREAGARHAVPIIQGHGLATAAVVPVRNCGQCAAVPSDGGKLVPIIDAGRCPGSWCRAGPPSCPSSTAGKVVPVVSCRSTAGRSCPSCRAAVPIIDSREGRAHHPGPRPGNGRGGARRADRRRQGGADRRREGNAHHAAPPCRSSTLPRCCPSCRSTARKVVPIIRGNGLAMAAVVPVVSVMPIIDSREAGAHRAAVPIDGGKVVPSIQGHGSQRPRWCPSCRSTAGKVVPVVPRCRSTAGSWCPSSRATAWQRPRWCPWFPSCRSSTAGKVVPVVPRRRVDRRREAGAHHPGPRPGNGRGGARGARHAHH